MILEDHFYFLILTIGKSVNTPSAWSWLIAALPGIGLTLPRTRTNSTTIGSPVYVNATSLSGQGLFLPMVHLIPVPKADSTITIEIRPVKDTGHNLTLLLRWWDPAITHFTQCICICSQRMWSSPLERSAAIKKLLNFENANVFELSKWASRHEVKFFF